MALVLKPPTSLDRATGKPSIFLAGSIEMGTAGNWQQDVTEQIASEDLVILNPRRDDWDASWEQTMTHSKFREQVEWELAAQEMASVIVMYFDPDTRAPITLLELGLFARTGKVMVCCPDGFWRKGNVEIVCARYGVPVFEKLSELIESARAAVDANR